MLVLTRNKNESIMIGDDIVVTVVDISGDRVRLGIQAPKTISVHRQEVYEAIQAENRVAGKAQAADLSALENLLVQRNKKNKER